MTKGFIEKRCAIHLPDNWEPSDEYIKCAKSKIYKSRKKVDLDEEILKFKEYWYKEKEKGTKKGKKSYWGRAFLKWVDNAIRYKKYEPIRLDDSALKKREEIEVDEEQKNKGRSRIEELKRQARGGR